MDFVASVLYGTWTLYPQYSMDLDPRHCMDLVSSIVNEFCILNTMDTDDPQHCLDFEYILKTLWILCQHCMDLVSSTLYMDCV